MSLSMRQPISRYPDASPPASTQSAGHKRHIPPTTPPHSRVMASSDIYSSPSSSPPASIFGKGTPQSSATAHLSTEKDAAIDTSLPESEAPHLPFNQISVVPEISNVATAVEIEPQSEGPSSPKRARDDGEDELLPPKKRSTKSGGNGQSRTTTRTSKAATPNKPTTKKAPQKKPITPPSTRPSRNRKAPDRFQNFAQPPPPEVTPARKGPSRVFDPTYITTNSTSRLGKADVYHMLLEPAAWTSLTSDQRKELLSMLPHSMANKALLDKIEKGEIEDTRPDAFTISNDCFRTDVAKFKEDLKNGHLAKTWQTAAHQAVIARAAGEYDEWKAQEAELWWGQKTDPEA